jgi:hypothetical protein
LDYPDRINNGCDKIGKNDCEAIQANGFGWVASARSADSQAALALDLRPSCPLEIWDLLGETPFRFNAAIASGAAPWCR